MSLKLSLKPGERIAINGAVLTNGDRRCAFIVENPASILRDRDIMKPEDATTPARHVYFAVMTLALGAASGVGKSALFEDRIRAFASAVDDVGALDLCARIAARVANRDYYKALALCRRLMDFERTRLPDVA